MILAERIEPVQPAVSHHPVERLAEDNNSDLLQRIETIASESWYLLGLGLAVSAVITGFFVLVLPCMLTYTLLAISVLAFTVLCTREALTILNPYMSEEVQKVANFVQATLEDILLLMSQFLMKPLFIYNHLFKKKAPGDGIPTIFIHGYASDPLVATYAQYKVEQAGYGPFHFLSLGLPFFHNTDAYAQKVKHKVDRIVAETGSNRVRIIAHSMGGVVALRYLTRYAGNVQVTELVTAGSPLDGTRLAYLGFDGCAKDMRPGSDVLVDLAQRVNQVRGTRFLHFASETDLIIQPYTSSLFEANQNENTEREVLKATGHQSYYFKSAVLAKIIDFFRRGENGHE